MNKDWQSFNLTLYDSAYYLGYSKEILPTEPIYTCQNKIFSENWSTKFNLDTIYKWIEKELTDEEKQYLITIKKDLKAKYPNKSTSPEFFNRYLLIDDELTPEKIFAYVGDSLFGRNRSGVIS